MDCADCCREFRSILVDVVCHTCHQALDNQVQITEIKHVQRVDELCVPTFVPLVRSKPCDKSIQLLCTRVAAPLDSLDTRYCLLRADVN